MTATLEHAYSKEIEKRDKRIAELEAVLRRANSIANRLARQADVADQYSNETSDAMTWRIQNSHFRDMARELSEITKG